MKSSINAIIARLRQTAAPNFDTEFLRRVASELIEETKADFKNTNEHERRPFNELSEEEQLNYGLEQPWKNSDWWKDIVKDYSEDSEQFSKLSQKEQVKELLPYHQ